MLTNSKPTVGLVSLGCCKNLVDTQLMCGWILASGMELSPDPDNADVILVNTCAFIESARAEAIAEIERACGLKQSGHARAVVVTGCYPQRYGDSLAAKFPGVDAWLGIDHVDEITDVIGKLLRARKPKTLSSITSPAKRTFEPIIPELKLTDGPFAYVKVAEGCNHACAFCAIPGIRGHLRSRAIDDIVEESRALLASGVRELVLVAQDTTAYGWEKHDLPKLPALLRKLDKLPGDFRMRILYGYPSHVDDALVKCFKDLRHLCKYIDIPLQHSHPDILKAMRRGDSINAMENLVRKLRKSVPGIAIRTTLMVGYPGETEEHFRHLEKYVADSKFDALGVFVFSPEEGTAAGELEMTVAPDVAERRRDKIMRMQRKIAADVGSARVGTRTDLLLFKDLGRGRWMARAEWQAPDVDGCTLVTGVPKGASPGDFVRAIITAAKGYDLKAEVL